MISNTQDTFHTIVATLAHEGEEWVSLSLPTQISDKILQVLRATCVNICKLPCRCKQIPWAFGYVHAFKFSNGTVWDASNGWRVKPVKLRLENDLPVEPDRALAVQQLAEAYREFAQQRSVCESNGLRAVVDGDMLIIIDNRTGKHTQFRCIP